MRAKKSILSLAVSLAMTTGLAVSAQVNAAQEQVNQTQAEQEQQNNKNDSFEKIVVTSQKRTQSLNEVPVAVSVLNSDQINSAFANNMEGLQSLVPSVSFRKGTTTRNSALTVRGIGTISFSIAAEPSVATVVDGVVLGRSGQAFADLYDVDRIEVLRGPQGTLFGKNASAGVVNITTKDPSYDTTGSIETSFYQDNEYRFKGVVSGGLSDDLAASLTVFKGKFDGYIDNVYNNEKVNGYDREGARAVFKYEPTDDLNVKFITEYYNADDDCCADLEALPSGRNPDSKAAPNSNGIVDGVADIDLDQRKVDHDYESRTIDKHSAFSVQVDKTIGDHTYTSITAQRSWDNTEFREGDFTSIAGDSNQPVFGVPFQLHDIGEQQWDQFSQEFRVTSNLSGPFNYVAGLFYWNMDSQRNFTRDASCQNNAGQLDSAMAFYAQNNLSGAELDAALADLDGYAQGLGVSCNANDIVSATAYMSTEFNNWAAFADGTYELSDDLTMLFGLRYTDDEVSYTHRRVSNDVYGRRGVGVRPATLNTDEQGKAEETNVSGRLGMQYDLGDGQMVYGTYSQGYKGPGFNIYYNFNPDNDGREIAPEESDAFELGYKYASSDFVFNFAVFKTEIEGFQANNFDCSDGTCITRLTNAGDVSTQGAEVDFMWAATDALTLTGGIAYIKAEIDEFNCPPEVAAGSCTDRSGLDVPFSPDLKYSLSADYFIETEHGFNVHVNGSYIYTDEQYSDLPNNVGEFNPAALLPDYGILNASVGLSFKDDAFRVSLIAKNLTDESYATTYSGDNFRYQIPRDAERYFGVSFKARF
ncbi:iron complex outermembrane recepter protein [Pseudoalteromonas marina]|uniref:TonB-dependent receptor n=1 Tax=Pseudoalteromonas marina TaxID=267375 RepID=UPI00026CEFD6|nr:TonB-dependent receptor [Pseudoalteromonas marina]KAF7774574.1 iron complex outermembrane recepter protein [Pseudoalteromonas marina]